MNTNNTVRMIQFSKEEIQYFIDTVKEATQEEFEDQDLRSELMDAKKILVAGIKGVAKGGQVMLTPWEAQSVSVAMVDAAQDDYMDIGVREELHIAARLINNNLHFKATKVAV